MLLQFNNDGEIELTPEARELSDENIYHLIDEKFPYRNENGDPSYRGNQRIIIFKMIKACLDGKRFVMLDAPVGAGKSIILYTTMIILGPSVYLTPQTQLQDQIARENWPNVRSLKGKGNYACNYVSLSNDVVRCNYSGDEFETCNNSDRTYAMSVSSADDIMNNIRAVLANVKDSRQRQLHTAFETIEEAMKIADSVRADAPDTIRYPVASLMGCSMAPVECVYKTVRLAAKYSGVRVITPDIYYLLDKYTSIFSNSMVMCIDECHTMENTIQRMFRTIIPIDTMKSIFGMDLSPLLECKGAVNFSEAFQAYFTSTIKPLMAAMRVVKHMGDLLKIEQPGGIAQVHNKSDFTRAFMLDSNTYLNEISRLDSISVFEIINAVFCGDIHPHFEFFPTFVNKVRVYYKDQLDALGLDKDSKCDCVPLITSCSTYVRKTMMKERRHSVEYEAIRVASAMSEIVETWNDTIILMSFIKYRDANDVEYPVFTTDAGTTKSLIACEGGPLQKLARRLYRTDPFHEERTIEVVPINIATIMNFFFYRKFRTIFLSTGTWVDLIGKKKIYGITDSCEHIKVPSIFNRQRRPVFVLDNSKYTNFSEKTEDKSSYVYRTEEGTAKFIAEFEYLITAIRQFILKQDGIEKPNIIVHCHTFDLAKRIAEFCHVDPSYLIHLGKDIGLTHNNVHSGPIEIFKKEEILERIIKNPDSGLVVISPSINEGVDFKHGIARAQIILKRPVPYMGDMYVRTVSNGSAELGLPQDPRFFDREVFTTTTQQYGRIMRAETDWGYTFIVDQSMMLQLKTILQQRMRGVLANMNIGYFVDGIQYISGRNGVAFIWPLDDMYK